MTPENLRAIRAIHARIVPAMIAGRVAWLRSRL